MIQYSSILFSTPPEPKGEFEKIVIPLIRVQNLFMIEVKIDSIVGNFILDTGAPHLVLNKTYFNNWRVADGTTAYGITGGGNQVYYSHVDSLVIDALHYESIEADLVDLGHLENARGVKILGLLGANLFFELEMEIDLKNNRLILYRTDKDGNRISKDPVAVPNLSVPVEIENDIIFVNGIVGDKKLRFCFDTGAESNAISNTVNNKVLTHFSLTGRTKLGGSGYQSIEVLNGQIDELKIGDRSFKDLSFVLTDLSYLQLVYETNLNGMLGYPFLINGIVVLNFKKKTLNMYFYKEEEK